jgi:hypothetical protein
MRQVAAGLSVAGLESHVRDTQDVLDVTATLEGPGSKAAEVIVEEDGYTEIRYWNQPGATPGNVTAVIVRSLAAIAASQVAHQTALGGWQPTEPGRDGLRDMLPGDNAAKTMQGVAGKGWNTVQSSA